MPPYDRHRMIRLAQLSDTHILGDPHALLDEHNTARQLERVVATLAGRADTAVITGDLADGGDAEAYKTTRSIVDRLACDVHVVLGNHDNAALLAGVFEYDRAPRSVTLSRDWSMVLVDSCAPNEAYGHLDATTLTLLDDALARTSNNAVVCMHHPPDSPCDYDYCVITNASEVLDVITRHGCVRAVLSGHHHRAFETSHAGSRVRFLGAPSTFRQLDHGGDPHFTETSEPPAARLVELHDDGTIATEIVSLPL
jgi:3',5'-cyclic-AMP phosphodiesterase